MKNQEHEYYFVTKNTRCLTYHHRLCEELYLFMCGMEQLTPGKSFGPVARRGYHLHVILSGEGFLEVNGNHIALHAGQMFLVKPDEMTYYYASREKPWSYCWVSFGGNQADYYMEQAGFTQGVNALNSYIKIEKFYDLVNQLLSKPELNLANDLRRQGLLNQFVGLAIESRDRSSGHGKRNAVYSTDSYIDHALDYIHGNYNHMKISDLSAFIGIDRSYLSNIFHKRVGVSPQRYLIGVRMRKSVELLQNTDYSIKEIASKVGYDDALTFSKMFKSFYGVSPTSYRVRPPQDSDLPSD